MSEHNKETFYVCNSKYVAKIEWHEEDNLYVGTLVSELRNYGNLALFKILFIFMEETIMK